MISSPEYTRLHISPLSAILLPSLLPPSILPHARNISYHTLQTYPDQPYGFLDLPTMDASKLKTKLNGSILKGHKIKIESARPPHVHSPEEAEEETPKREKKKKRKRDEIPGAEIGERSVKRGWTDPALRGKLGGKDKKDRKVKSKYSTGKECLFKTVLPANVAANATDAKAEKKDKRRKRDREVVVHEFEKTTKYPTFLKSSTIVGKKKGVREFVEGKGWVDEDGEVIESVVEKKSRKSDAEKHSTGKETSPCASTPPAKVAKAPIATHEEHDTSSSGSSSDSESETDAMPAKSASWKVEKAVQATQEEKEETSSSGSSSSDSDLASKPTTTPMKLNPTSKGAPKRTAERVSDSDSSSSESDSEDEPIPKPPSTLSVAQKAPSHPASSSSPGLTIKIPIPTLTTTPIHPLEALYKKPRRTPDDPMTKPAEAFSFFAGGDDEEEEVEVPPGGREVEMPFTPFTQREFEFRGLRSAAPTPDTAHGNKRFLWPGPADGDEDEEREERSSPVRQNAAKGKDKGKSLVEVNDQDEIIKRGDTNRNGEEQESEFQKWFYEHRGDTSRAWKKRRREAAKEKRQSENRKRGDTK